MLIPRGYTEEVERAGFMAAGVVTVTEEGEDAPADPVNRANTGGAHW